MVAAASAQVTCKAVDAGIGEDMVNATEGPAGVHLVKVPAELRDRRGRRIRIEVADQDDRITRCGMRHYHPEQVVRCRNTSAETARIYD